KGRSSYPRHPGSGQLRSGPGLGGSHRREHDPHELVDVTRQVTRRYCGQLAFEVIELVFDTLCMSGQTAATLRKKPAALQPTERIFSWGRYPKTAHQHVHKPAWNDQVPEILK